MSAKEARDRLERLFRFYRRASCAGEPGEYDGPPFTVVLDARHVELARHIRWMPILSGCGAIAPDPEATYGVLWGVFQAIDDIIGERDDLPEVDLDADGLPNLWPDNYKALEVLHFETMLAPQVWLSRGAIETGTFRRDRRLGPWEKVDDGG